MPRAKLYAKSHALLPAILNKARGDETGEVFWVRCVGAGRALAVLGVIRVGCWCVGGADSGRVLVVRWLWAGVSGGVGGDSGRVLVVLIRVGRGALAAVIRVGCWWCVGSGRALAGCAVAREC